MNFLHKWFPTIQILAFFAIVAVALMLAGCRAVVPFEGTGVGRAWNQAWFGTPPEVVEAVQFLDRRMREELEAKYQAIEEANVTDPKTGQVVQAWAEARFRDLQATHAELEHWNALVQALAAYVGADLKGGVSEAQAEADRKRQEFWGAVLKGLQQAQKPAPGKEK